MQLCMARLPSNLSSSRTSFLAFRVPAHGKPLILLTSYVLIVRRHFTLLRLQLHFNDPRWKRSLAVITSSSSFSLLFCQWRTVLLKFLHRDFRSHFSSHALTLQNQLWECNEEKGESAVGARIYDRLQSTTKNEEWNFLYSVFFSPWGFVPFLLFSPYLSLTIWRSLGLRVSSRR